MSEETRQLRRGRSDVPPMSGRAVEVAVIADDLAGAADTGAAFARAGLPTLVSLDGGGDAQVVSIDTATRRCPPWEAAARAGQAAVRYADAAVLYKKLDSTLRGAVGRELGAVVAATGRRAVVAPAFPATGRTVRDGALLVNGLPLAEAGVWREEDGVAPSDITSLLMRAGLAARQVELVTVRAGGERLRAALGEVPAGHAAVCDAETDADLERIARACAALAEPVVWAGSAGLAGHLPQALGLVPPARSAALSPRAAGPILFVVGTPSAVAADQVRSLLDRRPVRAVAADARMLLGPPGDLRPCAEALGRALGDGDAVLVVSGGQAQAIGTPRTAARLAASLGALAANRLPGLGGLVVTGGDTVRAVLDAAGVRTFRLDGEVEPGVAVGRLRTDREVTLVTKAGAFGGTATLVRAYDVLRAGG